MDISPDKWPAVLRLVTHQLRVPIGLIGGYTDMLRDDQIQGDPARRRHILHELRQNVLAMHQLVTQLEEGSRVASGALPIQRRRLAVRALIDETVERSAPMCELRKASLSPKLMGPVAGYVQGDRYYLGLSLMNLIDNAAKYGKPGGRVRLVAEPLDEMIEFRIVDGGAGLGANGSQFFAPFVQGSRMSEGLGLGLTLVKTIVEAHGGSMAWRSGRESYVGFRIPWAPN